MRKYAAIIALSGLAACARPGAHPVLGANPVDHWLVGGWVPQGAPCESDAGVVFRRDGSWETVDSGGRWHGGGKSATLTVTRSGGPMNSLLDRSIERIGPGQIVARSKDGAALQLRRCDPL